ncbi:phosphate signaling complex protein PhoU [Methanoculleus bourgensis]|jgi:phosphate transport system protein|uniref:phosphate signaling complex protein PhoU n=1 Tax=Methanoculleus bourgensis TaxID=83986 RepID=UPI0007BC9D2B|nr:phosphate signaling complex protein PhoU [Methanoculleus bourgensis]NQS74273.1 phosphate signaling complex protein PhoU [Methanoculleus sp.]MBT0733308.1 phosphate signaling complex protein PhoU [Methanoculleus bourgensis]MDD3372175.1 phosphate signaling complex protein PhoU [Methanoculleus bourgensis]NMA88413.1 phosphate signaling complex protein PhoU [Methanoculleus bourgensis]SAI88438.1 phosphate transport system protein [Methanoculleus bourgensis]
MVNKYREELKDLKDMVQEQGVFAYGMLSLAMTALQDQDPELARQVHARRVELAERNLAIEEAALRLIALYQPMARDLRSIVCALRMNVALFRIGRYGKDIANLVEGLSEKPHIGNLMNLPHMADLVCAMIDDALKAYRTEDIVLIEGMSRRDDVVDDLRYAIFRESVTYMMEDPKNITRCMDYVMVARYLERCGDYACDIAEQVCYMVTGERVEVK